MFQSNLLLSAPQYSKDTVPQPPQLQRVAGVSTVFNKNTAGVHSRAQVASSLSSMNVGGPYTGTQLRTSPVAAVKKAGCDPANFTANNRRQDGWSSPTLRGKPRGSLLLSADSGFDESAIDSSEASVFQSLRWTVPAVKGNIAVSESSIVPRKLLRKEIPVQNFASTVVVDPARANVSYQHPDTESIHNATASFDFDIPSPSPVHTTSNATAAAPAKCSISLMPANDSTIERAIWMNRVVSTPHGLAMLLVPSENISVEEYAMITAATAPRNNKKCGSDKCKHWTKTEDAILKHAIGNAKPPYRWGEIARIHFPSTRNGNQVCSLKLLRLTSCDRLHRQLSLTKRYRIFYKVQESLEEDQSGEQTRAFHRRRRYINSFFGRSRIGLDKHFGAMPGSHERTNPVSICQRSGSFS
jgi:hypothetical protein